MGMCGVTDVKHRLINKLLPGVALLATYVIAFPVERQSQIWCNSENRDKMPKLMLCYISLSPTHTQTLSLSLYLSLCVRTLIKYACSLNFFNLKPLAVKFCGLVRRLIKVAWQQSCPQLYFYFYAHLPAYTLPHTHTHTGTDADADAWQLQLLLQWRAINLVHNSATISYLFNMQRKLLSQRNDEELKVHLLATPR